MGVGKKTFASLNLVIFNFAQICQANVAGAWKPKQRWFEISLKCYGTRPGFQNSSMTSFFTEKVVPFTIIEYAALCQNAFDPEGMKVWFPLFVGWKNMDSRRKIKLCQWIISLPRSLRMNLSSFCRDLLSYTTFRTYTKPLVLTETNEPRMLIQLNCSTLQPSRCDLTKNVPDKRQSSSRMIY